MKGTEYAFAGMPRQELRSMLAAELAKDIAADGDLVRALLAELQRRGNDPAYAEDGAVEAACEKFRQDTEAARKPRKWRYTGLLLKVASILLVLSLLFFGLPAATQAGKVQDVLGWWSDSIFRLFTPGKEVRTQEAPFQTDHPGLQEIYDTVTELGITERIVPQELDKDFELIELKTVEMYEDTTVHCRLANNHNKITFTIIIHDETAMLQYEKTAENVSVWELEGAEYYVISNTEDLTVTWFADNTECTVITDCPEEDVYDFIKSIYTSEG